MAPMRRKSQGSIRSPHVKRNFQSQVTLEGWLFKLEGGALKQWKLRWCVLTDFCLFFYKAPHEEKVTSSILLPSYKINPCCADDKISKKFAFKAEHQNMKTYYFAAEDKESMKKWMNAMSLATIMQMFVNVDDDDSGFTSYRSRRHPHNRSSSAHDSGLTCEPLKQRSSSCGDRVGEIYLGNDDKYPSVYKSIPSHLSKVPQAQQGISAKQPLYANAPPKPRRLTQTDNFAIFPSDCYDNRDPHLIAMEPGHYNFETSDNQYQITQENVMQYLAIDSEDNNSVFLHSTSPHVDNRVAQYSTCENTSENLKMKTPRPRSADFLDRDNECITPPYIAEYPESQPQRPKSSLEYYGRMGDSDEYDFDDYREAVRLQADNLYSNKYLMRNRKSENPKHVENSTNSKLYSQYVKNKPSLSNENVPSHLPQNHTSEGFHEQLSEDNSVSSHRDHYNSYSNSKFAHNESMQRLLEWKQRMLLSPLSRRNQLHSVSSDASSVNSLKQTDYYLKKYGKKKCNSFVENKYPNTAVSSEIVGLQESSNYWNVCSQDKSTKTLPYETDVKNSEILNGSDNSYHNNIMYCVDSENNEILFTCDASPNSPTFHSNHYPPQMHSFSTLPNVNDVGIESSAGTEHATDFQPVRRKHYKHETTHKMQGIEKRTTYSSDDEASVDSDNKHRSVGGKVTYENVHSSNLGSESISREALHLKKLVQQSNGLMCKGKRLSVSAGDLLGKTHEELVLLLIQLRRNQAKMFKAKEKLECKIEKDHSSLQIGHRQINESYKELCNQIVHLKKQYETTQPLVTLVDNMVKLGSLYGSSNRRSFSLPILDSANEDSTCSDAKQILPQSSTLSNLFSEENDFQTRLNEINNLEKGLHYETSSISTLHQDKEMLEHTLFGMQNKILDHQDRPAELQKLRKQQRLIEKELVRVKRLLSTSAKKIEDAASKNDQMEKEILHLRQILQQALKTGSTDMKTTPHSRADLEAELIRLQSVLDELANHRHEINNTVEKLKSEARSSRSKVSQEVRASPTGVAGSAPLPLRKKQSSMYLETDLDTMVTHDLAIASERELDDIPVYANAEDITFTNEESISSEASVVNDDSKLCSSQVQGVDVEPCTLQDINEADERMKRFYGNTKKTLPLQNTRPSSINLCTSVPHNTNLQTAHERLFGNKQKSFPQLNAVKKSKRRHYTVSGYQYMLDPQFSQYFTERPRSRDDVDMERCLRTANTPDIVRSTIKKNDIFDEKIIDRELGLPQKIEIPERYVEIEPEQLSATEKLRRSLKAENICKMLSQTTTSYEDVAEKQSNSPETLHKKLSEEKRKRAHLLSLNQALAREVVERSKAVAANIYPLENQAAS